MKKKGKIARRTLLLILLVLVILSASTGITIGIQLNNIMHSNYEAFAISYVKSAAKFIDGDKIEEYVSTGKKDEYYQQVNKFVNAIAESTINPDSESKDGVSIKYLYVFIPNEKDFTYIWDAEPGSEPEDFLAKYPYSEGAKEQVDKIVAKKISEDSQYYTDSETGEHILTVSVPLCDSKGNVVAIIAADLSVAAIDRMISTIILNVVVLIVIIMAIIMLVYYFIARKLIVRPIIKLQDATKDIVKNIEDDRKLDIDIKTNDEIEMLADSIIGMDTKLRDYIKQNAAAAAEKERITSELELAAGIQSHMLPITFPAFPEREDFDIYATMTPAKEVGGDFYDFFLIDKTHLGIVMADVSGKGIPAALFMMMSKILIQNAVLNDNSPAEALEIVNNQICANSFEEMFVTVWLGILDLKNGVLRAANAGHEKPILKHPNGSFELHKDIHGFVIGGLTGIKYHEYTMRLEKGSKLFIYTDGVPEATNADEELFGIDRTLDALNEVGDESPQVILDNIKKRVDEFVGNAPQFDDLTMLCLEYFGMESESSLTLDATIESIADAVDFVKDKAKNLPFSNKEKYQLEIAVDEIMNNIASYAYQDKVGKAEIKVETDSKSISITFMDSGIPYNPLEKDDPDITLPAEERGIGGYGIFLVKKIMDDVKYEYKDNKNVLTITKKYK